MTDVVPRPLLSSKYYSRASEKNEKYNFTYSSEAKQSLPRVHTHPDIMGKELEQTLEQDLEINCQKIIIRESSN